MLVAALGCVAVLLGIACLAVAASRSRVGGVSAMARPIAAPKSSTVPLWIAWMSASVRSVVVIGVRLLR